MKDEKALALFKETLAKTQEGRIPWEPAVVGDSLIAAIKGKYSLVLRREEGELGTGRWVSSVAKVTLTMRDQSDREILSVTNDVDGVETNAIGTLYDAARRQAYQVDRNVDDLISDLRSL